MSVHFINETMLFPPEIVIRVVEDEQERELRVADPDVEQNSTDYDTTDADNIPPTSASSEQEDNDQRPPLLPLLGGSPAPKQKMLCYETDLAKGIPGVQAGFSVYHHKEAVRNWPTKMTVIARYCYATKAIRDYFRGHSRVKKIVVQKRLAPIMHNYRELGQGRQSQWQIEQGDFPPAYLPIKKNGTADVFYCDGDDFNMRMRKLLPQISDAGNDWQSDSDGDIDEHAGGMEAMHRVQQLAIHRRLRKDPARFSYKMLLFPELTPVLHWNAALAVTYRREPDPMGLTLKEQQQLLNDEGKRRAFCEARGCDLLKEELAERFNGFMGTSRVGSVCAARDAPGIPGTCLCGVNKHVI